MLPTVTALTITKGRTNLCTEAIRDYQRQTYVNRRMLIVTDGPEHEKTELARFIESDPSISILCLPESDNTLGHLRNISLENSLSDWTIQWDDDDWYHPERIECQVSGIIPGKAAVYLQEQLHYLRSTNEVAWIQPGRYGKINGTILYDRRFGYKYPDIHRSEDAVLADQLDNLNLYTTIPGGILYCRTYHGNNTWSLKHHLNRIIHLGSTVAELEIRRGELEEAAQIYAWPKGWKAICRPNKPKKSKKSNKELKLTDLVRRSWG